MMKKSMFALLAFGLNIQLYAQTKLEVSVFYDLVNFEVYAENKGKVGYSPKVHLGMFKYHYDNFAKDSLRLQYRAIQKATRKYDTITLTREEKQYLITELKKAQDFEWKLKPNPNLISVALETSELAILNFLKEDRLRRLKLISKPVFIRNNSIACVYSAHLCCGSFYGYTSLSFYKEVNGIWTEWIHISVGNF